MSAGLLLMEGEAGFALIPRSMLCSGAVRGLTPSALRVWLALLSRASHESPRPFPSWETIGRDTALCRSQVAVGVSGLKRAGLLDVRRRGSLTPVYTLCRPAPDEVRDSRTSDVRGSGTSDVRGSGTSDVRGSGTSDVRESRTLRDQGRDQTEEAPLTPRTGARLTGLRPGCLARLLDWSGAALVARWESDADLRALSDLPDLVSGEWLSTEARALVRAWRELPEDLVRAELADRCAAGLGYTRARDIAEARRELVRAMTDPGWTAAAVAAVGADRLGGGS